MLNEVCHDPEAGLDQARLLVQEAEVRGPQREHEIEFGFVGLQRHQGCPSNEAADRVANK